MKDLRNSKQLLVTFFNRYHLVIFIVIIVILLSIAVLMLSRVANKASGENITAPGGDSSGFDQGTIDRIKELKTSDQPSTPLDLSNGRIDPFNE